MKTISIILTTYNSGKTIQRAIDSVNKQEGLHKLFEIELIVVDDCSEDDTSKILLKNNIDFISTKKNSGGPNIGRNIGLEKASGDFICIMDHDDEWLPEKLKSQLEVSELAPIISTGYRTHNLRNGTFMDYIGKPWPNTIYILYKENETFKTLLSRSKIGQITYIGGLMFHSSLKDIRFEEKFAQVDFDWGLRLFQYMRSVEICKPLYIRNVLGDNLSFKEEYRLNDYNYSFKTVEKYKGEYPEQVKDFYKRSNGTLGRYYYHKEEMSKARKYFFKAGFNLRVIFYIITSYYGYKFVNRRFRVF